MIDENIAGAVSPGKRFTDHPKVKIFLLSLLLLVGIVLSLATFAAAKLKRPYVSNPDNAPVKVVEVKKGQTTSQIAQELENDKIIGDYRYFVYYILIKGGSKNIQAGNYQLSGSMTIPEIVERLTSGKVVANEVRIRIGEGWTIDQIGQAITDSGLGTKQEFFNLVGTTPSNGGKAANTEFISHYAFLSNLPKGASLEGYLFPDTYIVSRVGGVDELVDKMLKNYDKKVNQNLSEDFTSSNHSARQVLIIASLVEAEVGRNVTGTLSEDQLQELSDERAKVSQVFWTRLNVGMAFESDATIGYATGKPRRSSTLADLQINSPYNTYKFAGFPPGPIGNPSLDSIKAALHPADTNYLFFLSAPDGKAYFAKTLAEHNANRAKYMPAQ